jgi:hypothetical protein
VPTGEYQLAAGLVERFSCAPGPVGWRYVGTGSDGSRVDVAVDSRWRQARVEVRAASWSVRGGVAGRELLWVRAGLDGTDAVEQAAPAAAFTGRSPVFLITIARMLALQPAGNTTVALVEVAGDALATRRVRQRWTLHDITAHAADLGVLRVEQYEVADLDTGETGEVQLAGDVVLAAPGVELTALDGPPNQSPTGESR